MKRCILFFVIGIFLITACGQSDITHIDRIESSSSLTAATAESTESVKEEVETQSQDLDNPAATTIENISEVIKNCRVKTPEQQGYSVLPRPDENDHSLGPDDAYVTIIEYGDFQ